MTAFTTGAALVYLPIEYDRGTDKFPLILFLHGAGEKGHDLSLVKREALPRLLEHLAHFPFVVVSPQRGQAEPWSLETLSSLLDEVESRFRIDRRRISFAGLSDGAVACLRLAVRDPGRVAAVVAVAPHLVPDDLCRLKRVPVRLFHNRYDNRVPPRVSRRIERTLADCGGDVRLTIFEEETHDAWTQAFGDGRLYEWLLLQHSGAGLAGGAGGTPVSSPASMIEATSR